MRTRLHINLSALIPGILLLSVAAAAQDPPTPLNDDIVLSRPVPSYPGNLPLGCVAVAETIPSGGSPSRLIVAPTLLRRSGSDLHPTLMISINGERRYLTDTADRPFGSVFAFGAEDGFLVLWMNRTGPTDHEIRASRVGTDGAVEPVPIDFPPSAALGGKPFVFSRSRGTAVFMSTVSKKDYSSWYLLLDRDGYPTMSLTSLGHGGFTPYAVAELAEGSVLLGRGEGRNVLLRPTGELDTTSASGFPLPLSLDQGSFYVDGASLVVASDSGVAYYRTVQDLEPEWEKAYQPERAYIDPHLIIHRDSAGFLLYRQSSYGDGAVAFGACYVDALRVDPGVEGFPAVGESLPACSGVAGRIGGGSGDIEFISRDRFNRMNFRTSAFWWWRLVASSSKTDSDSRECELSVDSNGVIRTEWIDVSRQGEYREATAAVDLASMQVLVTYLTSSGNPAIVTFPLETETGSLYRYPLVRRTADGMHFEWRSPDSLYTASDVEDVAPGLRTQSYAFPAGLLPPVFDREVGGYATLSSSEPGKNPWFGSSIRYEQAFTLTSYREIGGRFLPIFLDHRRRERIHNPPRAPVILHATPAVGESDDWFLLYYPGCDENTSGFCDPLYRAVQVSDAGIGVAYDHTSEWSAEIREVWQRIVPVSGDSVLLVGSREYALRLPGLDSVPFPIEKRTVHLSWHPTETGSVVRFLQRESDRTLIAQLYRPDGSLLGRLELPPVDQVRLGVSQRTSDGAVALSGSSATQVWAQICDSLLQPLAENGLPVGPIRLSDVDARVHNVDVIFDSTNVLAVWEDSRVDGSVMIRANRIEVPTGFDVVATADTGSGTDGEENDNVEEDLPEEIDGADDRNGTSATTIERVQPNPFYRATELHVTADSAMTVECTLVANDGRTLFRRTLELSEGLSVHRLDFSDIPSGRYLLLLSGSDSVEQVEIILFGE